MILLFALAVGLALDAQHHRDVRAGDVGIEQADRRARLRERDGEVDADRALADAALAGRDGDDVLDARHELLAWRGLARRTIAPQVMSTCLGAESAEDLADIALDLVLERTGRAW